MKGIYFPFLKSALIDSDELLLQFKNRANDLIGVDFPTSYLKQGLVRGFFNRKGELVGGYALITEGPFRTVRSLPDTSYLTYCENDVFEVTALWMDKSVKTGFLRSLFWIKFISDVFSIKDKKYYIYAYGLYNLKLRRIYRKANPDIIYRGPVKMLEGNDAEERESVEVAKISRMKLLPILVIPSIMKRVCYSQNDFVKNRTIIRFMTGRLGHR